MTYRVRHTAGSREASSFEEAVPVDAIQSCFEPTERRSGPLLSLLSLIKHRNISINSVRPRFLANISRGLGRGASGVIQLRRIPYGAQVSESRFQSIEASSILRAERFKDHAGRNWALNTEVAYKVTRTDAPFEQCVEEVTREAAILTHKALATHPNLVRLLGINWTPSTSQPSQERPSILTEVAQSDLLQLLQDRAGSELPLSFDAKFRLALDVLRGLKALHNCNIVHCDIKCENVLVYKSEERGNTENFIARIADFSGCLHLSSNSTQLSNHQFTRTKLYSPPELLQPLKSVTLDNAKAIDSWGWGMLLWQLMLDGSLIDHFDIDQDYRRLETIIIQKGRNDESAALKHEAAHSVRTRLSKDLNLAPSLIDLVCDLLLVALSKEPYQRANIEQLERMMTNQGAVSVKFDEKVDLLARQDLFEDLSLDDLPAFDICKLWDELIPHPSLCATVVNQLKILVENSSELSNDVKVSSEFQLALCYCSGLGCNDLSESQRKGCQLLLKLASEGHQKAQILAFRIVGTCDLEALHTNNVQVISWLKQGLLLESRIAREDLHFLNPKLYAETIEEIEHDIQSNMEASSNASRKLLLSCRNGVFAAAMRILDSEEGVNVNMRGSKGDTATHWLVNIMDDGQALNLLERLREQGADLKLAADLSCMYSSSDCTTELSFQNATPLIWAIAANRACLVERLLQISNNTHQITPSSIVCAIRHQSVECLEIMCNYAREQQVRPWLDIRPVWSIDHLDEWYNHPFFYVIRNDELMRVLHSRPRIDKMQRVRHTKSPQEPNDITFSRRTEEIIRILLRQRPNLCISPHPFNKWNVFHQAAGVGQPLILKVLLDEARPSSSILEAGLQWRSSGSERYSVGPTPLGIAARYGDVACIKLLVNAGVNKFAVIKISGDTLLHALCTCFAKTGAEATRYVLTQFPDLQVMRDRHKNLPIHTASWWGNAPVLAELLRALDNRNNGAVGVSRALSLSDILVTTNSLSITPLGCAIAGKSLPTVQELLHCHASTKRPLTVAIIDAGYLTKYRISAFTFLLSAGQWSDQKALAMGISGSSDRGCLDLPFSSTSKEILDKLLTARRTLIESKTKDKLIEDRTFNVWQTPNSLSGITEAVEICEFHTVEKLCRSQLFRPFDYRHLLRVAFLQLAVENRVHIASRKARIQMVEYLRTQDKNWFETLRRQRTSRNIISRTLWSTWYVIYGDILRKQEVRWDEWRRYHAESAGIPCIEFSPVTQFTTFWLHPLHIVLVGLSWILMVIYFAFLARFMVQHPEAVHPPTVVTIILSLLAVFLFMLVTVWPPILRICTIYFYEIHQRRFPAQDIPVDKPIIKYFQIFVGLSSFIAQGVTDFILMQMAIGHKLNTEATATIVVGIFFAVMSGMSILSIQLFYAQLLSSWAQRLKERNNSFRWRPSDPQGSQVLQGQKTVAVASWWYRRF